MCDAARQPWQVISVGTQLVIVKIRSRPSPLYASNSPFIFDSFLKLPMPQGGRHSIRGYGLVAVLLEVFQL